MMVGQKIREVRKKEDLSLSELAAKVGVSDSYISQLERNVVDPSVSALRKIAAALKVPISIFFDEDFPEPILVRAKGQEQLLPDKNGFPYMYLSPTKEPSERKLQMFSFQIPPKKESQPRNNPCETCIYLLQGRISIHLGENNYELQSGDSIYIRENVAYSMKNTDSTPGVGIAVTTRSHP